ncbi:MAG: Uma2 family endonuclease [Cyanobacteria bacterium P01_H01_bin.121]
MTVATSPQIPIRTLQLSPGSHVLIPEVTWQQYEALVAELGVERRVPRINYCDGVLELRSPLPAHARPHRILAYIVTTILDAQGRDWEDFGSTTFRKAGRAGLEPDTCFYIQNAERAKPLLRVDPELDPPPDLAIESDVTSKTTLAAYATLQVPEVWIYENAQLKIYRLQDGNYQTCTVSQIFPELDIVELLPRLVEQAFQLGTSRMLREFRKQL